MEMAPRRRALLTCAYTALIVIVCSGLVAAAALAPAPPEALPFVILTCIGCPMAAAFELARVLYVAREPRLQLRRELDRLPETPHPLGF